VIQQQRFKATCTCQARRPRKPRVATPRTFGMPRCHHWRTLRTARLCTSGPKWKCLYRCSRPSHRRDGCVPSPQTCVPSPQTFPPRRSSNVLPEPAPLAAAGDATSTAVVVSLQWQRLSLEWAVDITEIELMDPISCPTTWPVLLNIRGETTNCARPFSNFKLASASPSQPVTRNPFLPLRAPLIAFRPRLAPLDLHLNMF